MCSSCYTIESSAVLHLGSIRRGEIYRQAIQATPPMGHPAIRPMGHRATRPTEMVRVWEQEGIVAWLEGATVAVVP